MVTGLTMQAAYLAGNPANGQVVTYVVADGKFHQGGVTGPVVSDEAAAKAKLFQVQYTDVRGAPTQKAPQLEQAFAAIARATKAKDLDVRLYLDQRSDQTKRAVRLNQAVLIGPATQGTFMGNLGDAVGRPLGVEQAGAELGVGSGLVKRLNAEWPKQRDQLQGVTIIGISGAPTAGPGGLSNGDGFMPVRDLPLPGAATVVLRGADPTPVAHLMEVAYSGVIAEVQKKLGDAPR